MQLSLPFLNSKKVKTVNWDEFFDLYREPVLTYCIIPNNAPEQRSNSVFGSASKSPKRPSRSGGLDYDESYIDSSKSDWILNTINGLFSKFYLPERVRVSKNGIRIKLNDIVSYKVVIQEGKMKFYLTIPKRWNKQFCSAIRRDWGQVDMVLQEEGFVKFDPNKSKAMNIVLKQHHCLSIKYGDERNADPLYPALASIGSSMGVEDKLMIDFNIQPLGEEWRHEAQKKYSKFKSGQYVNREEKTINGIITKIFDFGDVVIEEMSEMIKQLMGLEGGSEKSKIMEFKPEYSDRKLHANSKGFKVQIRAVSESSDKKKAKHILKGVESSFDNLDGDNKFEYRQVKTKKGIKTIIENCEKNNPSFNHGTDIFFEKEMNQLIRLPNKQTLKENKKLIEQDNFTRTEIHEDFFKDENNALPIARTLEKEERIIRMPSYEREWWTDRGRKALSKTALDDNSQAELLIGQQGSGKTSKLVRDICQKFGAHLSIEEWKEKSKSVIAFDVADGEIIAKVWNQIPTELRDRVIILNHATPNNPIPVNFAELEEFNRNIMKDEDYSYKMAEMEANLVSDILGASKSTYVDRWFTTALQVAHMVDYDWGYAEAIRLLVDDEFRINEVMPRITDERMLIEMETYNDMKEAGNAGKIIETIQNRFVQLERDRKLWDCIAQRPIRDENGNCAINFRKWMDGDEDGAYLVLVYIPKDGVSKMFRKFLFAHYLMKIWNVALSREKGFAGREYRPETHCVIDEIHQIIDVPIVADMFVELFKEPRKYSLKLQMTLHGWSSIAKAGRTYESKIKQSILDNGCNLVLLKGGDDAFTSLENFLDGVTYEDYKNLMNMEYCGIFGIRWDNKYHVFQARLPDSIENDKNWVKYDNWDLYDLANYVSPYGREKDSVRAENLERIRSMLKRSIREESHDTELENNTNWEDIEND